MSVSELNFGLELARPETMGGVVVVLLQPAQTQTYTNGYTKDVDICESLKAVKELISVVNNYLLDFDGVSIFDTLPFLTEEYRDEDKFRDANNTFVQMIKAKRPDVVVCCCQGESQNQFVKDIRSLEVGKSFSPEVLQNGQWNLRRVNAFHPSYSVNYIHIFDPQPELANDLARPLPNSGARKIFRPV
jgi:hypothetical protein